MSVNTIAHYKVLTKLGEGGMGEVYLAEDTKLGRKVALKVVRAQSMADERAKKLLLREAQSAAMLDHPGICAVYEVGEDDGRSFIAMQYVEGETLHQRMQQGPFQLKEFLYLATNIADALAAAHARGIVHRDIKPHNIMLTRRGEPKVMDFGLAKAMHGQTLVGNDAATQSLLSAPGTIAGSVPFMSPEQLKGEELDARTDVFSLGIVFSQMLTGTHPFAAASAAETIAAILTHSPAAAAPATVPSRLRHLLSRCLAKDRHERYASASELLADLKQVSEAAGAEPVAERSGPSIAVLPFANMSTDVDNEYFCDGLAEELINALARIDGLKVAARTSAFSFKGKEKDIREIGRTLNVGTVLEGGVRKSSNRLRVTAELVDVGSGYTLWSERYDREMKDVFDVQDDISLAIVNALKVQLLGVEKQSLVKRYTDNTEAYELYLKARFHFNKYTVAGLNAAIDYFKQSAQQSRDYAPSYAGLAQCYAMAAFTHLSPSEAFPQAQQAAQRALDIDDYLGVAHTSLGVVKMYHLWDWSGAEQEFRRGIELTPGDASAHRWYGWFLGLMARFDEAFVQLERARELDPLDANTQAAMGQWFYWRGRYDAAIARYKESLALDPDSGAVQSFLLAAYMQSGRIADAIGALEMAAGSEHRAIALPTLGYAYARAGRRTEALSVLDDLRALAHRQYVAPFHLAMIYAALGQVDEAFSCLENAYEERSVWLAWLKVEPALEALRADSRFDDLLRRVRLAG